MSGTRKTVSLQIGVQNPTFVKDWFVTRDLASGKTAIAVGVSGGKDSAAVALRTHKYLEDVGWKGPRILIHSDLGIVEWKDSLPMCQRLAEHIGWELVVVKRKAGGMMERWNNRWERNVARYANLECVKLIMPWSSASMRFCTAELKRDVICSYLVKRFAGHKILSVTGIRREESPKRAKSPISKPQLKLTSGTHNTTGRDWHPILDWEVQTVFDFLRVNHVELHEAYLKYGSSRVSCCFCILAKRDDLVAASKCKDNRQAYIAMCELEAKSTFSFQPKQWLSNIAPLLLPESLRVRCVNSQLAAAVRQTVEKRIPDHLFYTEGWPTCLPTREEARLLASVRQGVAAATQIQIKYTTPSEVRDRYAELYEKQQQRLQAKRA